MSRPTNAPVTIALSAVTKSYGSEAVLHGIDLEFRAGALTALLGPSGSGKSTLLRIVAGLEPADAGTVAFDGRDVTTVPTQKREVGFVFQHYAAFRHMTVADNVGFGLQIRRRDRTEIRSRVAELLDVVGLSGQAARYPSQLSGGQRQRMALARALAVEPRVLLLDEPFGALDASLRIELRRWVRRLHDELAITTLFVTHDQQEAMELADDLVLLRNGDVVQHGAPIEVYDNPADAWTLGFLSDVSRFGDRLVRQHDLEVRAGERPGSRFARVDRVVYRGFDARVDLETDDGPVTARLAGREGVKLAPGDEVWVAPRAVDA